MRKKITNPHSYQETFMGSPKKRVSALNQILRWIVALPAGVVCAILVEFPIHWAVMLIQYGGKEEDGKTITIDNPLAAIPPDVLERFGYALFVPMVLITVGAIIAPRFKLQTGIVIAILFLGVIGYLCVGYNQDIDMSLFLFAITIILWIAGVTWGLYNAYNAHKESSKKSLQS